MTDAASQPGQPPANTAPKPGGNRTTAIVAAVAVPALALIAVIWFLRAGAYDVTIGVEGRRVVEIAGPELSAAPFTPGDAVSVRIAEAAPLTAGYRYDLRYMSFGPGKHDLAPLLKRPDGSSPESRADLRITVAALIPDDYSGELYTTATSPIDLHTRYKYYMGGATNDTAARCEKRRRRASSSGCARCCDKRRKPISRLKRRPTLRRCCSRSGRRSCSFRRNV
jgi:hypothetical protein